MDATEICNLALGRLGAGRIMALSEESQAARNCALFYEQTRDEVLRDHPWNFAAARETLVALVDSPIFGWEYAYQLPTDFIRLLFLNEYEAESIKTKWAIEGRRLLTDETEAQIRYTRKVTNASDFDALFIETLSLKLAAKLAMPLTKSIGLMETLLAEYEKFSLPRAKAADSSERNDETVLPWVNSALVRSRMG